MTTICATYDGKRAHIACDSQVTWRIKEFWSRPKWVEHQGWVVASSGPVRTLRLIERNQSTIFASLDAWDIAQAVRAMVKEDGYESNDHKGGPETFDTSMIICHASGAWEVCADWSVCPCPSASVVAAGTGASFAIGAAHALAKSAPKRRVIAAVEAAVANDPWSGGPIHYRVVG